MKFGIIASVVFIALLSANVSFAATLNITSVPVSVPTKSDLGTKVTMLNLTLAHDYSGNLKLNYINFTFNSSTDGINGSYSNLTICIGNETSLINCSSVWNTNLTNVSLGIVMANHTNYTLVVNYTIPFNSPYPINVSLYIPDNSSIALNESDVFINNSAFPIASAFTKIRVVTAYASISPRVVDTNVTNQTMKYVIWNSEGDIFNKVTIKVPPGFSLAGVASYQIYRNETNSTTSGGCQDPCSQSLTDNQINITDTTGMKNITVYFNVLTNASNTNSIAFNSTVDGTNMQNISTNVSGSATNVTTQNIITVKTVQAIKNAAYVNGTDYWMFKFTLNISADIVGYVQMKMSNWTSNLLNATINLTNSTTGPNIAYYASLGSSETNMSFNVTNQYNITQGMYLNATSGNLYYAYLRMTIPTGTPIASDWWATYNMLFRAEP